MEETQTEFGEGRPDIEVVKEMRRENPSGWLELSMDSARALLIDAILDAPPDYSFTPGEISPRAGISDQSVRNHIETLVKRGIVSKDENDRYHVNEQSRVLKEIEELNSAVTAIRSGATEDPLHHTDPADAMDNSVVDLPSDDFVPLPDSIGGRAINAD